MIVSVTRSARTIAGAAVLIAAAGFAQAQDAPAQTLVIDQAGNVAPELFVERAGSMEFSGSMIVRPKQDLFGNEAVRFEGGGIAAAGRGADAQPISDARARLVPNVIEHFADVDEYVVAVPLGMNENTFSDLLMATGDYEYAEPNWTLYTTNTPNDPQFGSQWHHDNMFNENAWDIETGSSDVIVAIVDTGIDVDHPEFDDLLVPGFNAVSNTAEISGGIVDDTQTSFGHGSFCAGMAAAEGNNGFGTSGVAWGVSLMPIKVTTGNSNSASSADLTQGARWAADNGARVVNVSFSGVGSSTFQTAGAYVEARGGVYVHSAGNDGSAILNFQHENVIVAGATTISNAKASFSNTGPGLDIVAPGASVFCAARGGGSGTASGTSFSAPAVAGVAALMFSANPSLTPELVRSILYSTTTDLGSPGEDDQFGSGLVNTAAAVAAAGSPPLEVEFTTTTPTVLAPDVATVGTFIQVTDNGDVIVDGPFLNIRKQGDASFQQIALNEIVGGLYEVVIPAQDCGDDPEYFISIEGQNAGVLTLPESGNIQALVGTATIVAADSGDNIIGISVSGNITQQSAGQWTAGAPEGNDRDDPSADFDGNNLAWLTGRTPGNTNSDVDGGFTTIESVDYDFSSGGFVNFAYWAADSVNTLDEATDGLFFEYSTNSGANWITVRDYGTANEWFTDSITSADVGTPASIRFRWRAQEDGTGDVFEAAIDAIEIGTLECEQSSDCLADVNGDGAVTPTDFTAWVNAFNNNLPECDQNGDGACSPTDFTAWVNNFNAGCP